MLPGTPATASQHYAHSHMLSEKAFIQRLVSEHMQPLIAARAEQERRTQAVADKLVSKRHRVACVLVFAVRVSNVRKVSPVVCVCVSFSVHRYLGHGHHMVVSILLALCRLLLARCLFTANALCIWSICTPCLLPVGSSPADSYFPWFVCSLRKLVCCTYCCAAYSLAL